MTLHITGNLILTLTVILGVTAFLAFCWGVRNAIKSVSEGSNFDEKWDKGSK